MHNDTLLGMITSKAPFPSGPDPTDLRNIAKNHRPRNTSEHNLITVHCGSESESCGSQSHSRSIKNLITCVYVKNLITYAYV